MVFVFYAAAAVAVVATILAVSARSLVHGLLNLIVSLLAAAVIFYTLGAPFAAAVEVILYAGAVMVLFLFAVMLIEQRQSPASRRTWRHPRAWLAPVGLALVLTLELAVLLVHGGAAQPSGTVGPEQVARALYGPYVVGVEAVSMLLFAALVGVFHLGRPVPEGGQPR
jgi:NADH-quinone oxidoreductase subunit J